MKETTFEICKARVKNCTMLYYLYGLATPFLFEKVWWNRKSFHPHPVCHHKLCIFWIKGSAHQAWLHDFLRYPSSNIGLIPVKTRASCQTSVTFLAMDSVSHPSNSTTFQTIFSSLPAGSVEIKQLFHITRLLTRVEHCFYNPQTFLPSMHASFSTESQITLSFEFILSTLNYHA